MKIDIPAHKIEVTFSEYVGMRLKQRRNDLGMSGGKLAQKSGLSQPLVSTTERGLSTLTHVSLFKMCKALDCPMDWPTEGWKDD